MKRPCRLLINHHYCVMSLLLGQIMETRVTALCRPFSKMNVKRMTRSFWGHGTILRSLSSNNIEGVTSWVGTVIETQHEGRTLNGMIRTVKRGGWFSIQLQHDPQSPHNYNGEFIHKRLKDIVMTTQAPSQQRQLHSSAPELSPPTIHNIDALLQSNGDPSCNKNDFNYYLQQASYFASFRNWVVFSDLHCSPTTLSTSLQVLQTVFQIAQQRKAGVIFLGDFWHQRGTIRFDCLNAILNAFQNWDRSNVPLIMIPGNHDQVTLQGFEHGLTPLQNAFFLNIKTLDTQTTSDFASQAIIPGVMIFTHPTIFQRAMFIPHIRDIATVQSILLHIHPKNPSRTHVNATTVDSILCHADVTGAIMNDHFLSTGGVSPSYFPPHIPVYSGHFHKPHVVETAQDVMIRYVGSPYQVSLAEAGDMKSLLVLDSHQGWKCIEEIPLNIGKKHYKCFNAQQLLQLSLKDAPSSHDAPEGVVTCGDRVVLSIQQQELEDMKRISESHIEPNHTDKKNEPTLLQRFEQKITELRTAGVGVEIREVKLLPNHPMVNLAAIQHPLQPKQIESSSNSTSTRIDPSIVESLSLEDLSPTSTLSSFLYHEVERGAMNNQTATTLFDAGNSLLYPVEKGDVDESNNMDGQLNRDTTDLCFDTVTITGFGPFKDSVTYPLMNRGLVLLRGSNQDGGSFDSNGSGKTTLAMSALWILTGSVDSRPLDDTKVADVVNDFSMVAKGILRGTINGTPFIISRSKTSIKGSLTFHMDGKDLTRQSLKETQNAIDEFLGVGPQILSRTIFHGQHTMNGLLEASDTKLKEELSLIVPIQIWQEASSAARSKSRMFSIKTAELDGIISIKNRDKNNLLEKCQVAKDLLDLKRSDYITEQNEIQLKLQNARNGMEHLTNLTERFEENQSIANVLSNQISSLEAQILFHTQNRDKITIDLRNGLVTYSKRVDDSKAKMSGLQRELDQTEYRINSMRTKLYALQRGIDNPEVCPTCKQPLNPSQFHAHIKQEHDEITTLIDIDEKRKQNETSQLEEERALLHGFILDMDLMQTQLQQSEEAWHKTLSELNLQLSSTRVKQMSLNEENSKILRQMNHEMEIRAQEISFHADLKRYGEMVESAKVRYETLQSELDEITQTISGYESDRDMLKSKAATMTTLADALGPRGIQTFILQNAVYSLQMLSQTYLDELSGGTLRLNLMFDSNERISRSADVLGHDGQWLVRPMSSLSGGQWRRCSLALSLGFSDLVSRRGRLRSSLLVLDEPLTHLDSSGRATVGQLLRKILQNRLSSQNVSNSNLIGGLATSTILIILQDLAAEELEESFDSIDVVTKMNGGSVVQIDQ